MKIGFTGTREGMTPMQFEAFKYILPGGLTKFYHGCCVGADEQAALHVNDLPGRLTITITAHPCNLPGFFSAEAMSVSDSSMPRIAPLARNHDIVACADIMIAAPRGPEERRSGTWATIRWARKKGKPIVFVWPDGSITEEAAKET